MSPGAHAFGATGIIVLPRCRRQAPSPQTAFLVSVSACSVTLPRHGQQAPSSPTGFLFPIAASIAALPCCMQRQAPSPPTTSLVPLEAVTRKARPIQVDLCKGLGMTAVDFGGARFLYELVQSVHAFGILILPGGGRMQAPHLVQQSIHVIANFANVTLLPLTSYRVNTNLGLQASIISSNG